MLRKEIIDLIGNKIREISPNVEIILYGSEARGNSKSDSDIDLLILIDDKFATINEKSKIFDALYEIELQYRVLINPVIYKRSQWNRMPFKTPFYVNVMNEGIVL